ncbi:hypothetical protein Ciccas_006365 [Cichlidogyrus casuarinus]|uniref:Guanine nucleotide-binding protein G(s) subunit alpha n=1 Tax=Cichlidogyrus casuarinus TaxID=1844966 RepID=A0ABD2Q5Y7_9PLAT
MPIPLCGFIRRRNSSVNDQDEEKKKEKEKSIEQKLKKDKKLHALTHKIPVIGSGESGKSTLIKQMQILYINGFTKEERKEKVLPIRKNIRDGILSICCAMSKIDPPVSLGDPSLQPSYDYITTVVAHLDESSDYPEIFYQHAEKLWKDEGVQMCFKRANEYQLIDSAGYFLDKCSTVAQVDYLPDDQDILRCRVLTSGIFETIFNVGKVRFHMYDVGGQKYERRKWIQVRSNSHNLRFLPKEGDNRQASDAVTRSVSLFQVLHDVTAVIFVVACSSYDSTMRESAGENRLKESIELFGEMWDNRFLSNTSIILFLNKQDLFEDKILHGTTKLETYFPAFDKYKVSATAMKEANEPEMLCRAKCFVRDQFMAISNRNADNTRRCYPHYTTAVDTNNIKRVFADCQNMLQRVYMAKMNML